MAAARCVRLPLASGSVKFPCSRLFLAQAQASGFQYITGTSGWALPLEFVFRIIWLVCLFFFLSILSWKDFLQYSVPGTRRCMVPQGALPHDPI